MFLKHKLWAFENGVQRKLLLPKREKVTGGWAELLVEKHIIVTFSRHYKDETT